MAEEYDIQPEEAAEADYYAQLEELTTDPIAQLQEAIAYLEPAKIMAWHMGHRAIEDRIKSAESYINGAINLLLKKEAK